MVDKSVSSDESVGGVSNGVSDETVSNKAVSSDESVGGVSNGVSDKSVTDNGVGNSMNKGGSMVSSHRGSNVSTSRGNGVLGLTGVSHLSNISLKVVGVVVDSLDSAVGKGNGVGARDDTGAVIGLALGEGRLGVVVSHGVLVSVRGRLSQVRGSVASGVDHGAGEVLGGGGGRSDKGKSNEGLKREELFSQNEKSW